MRNMLAIAVATLTWYWRRSLLLTLCVALSIFVPLTPWLLVRRAADTLQHRAASTPLLLASAGSKTDVVLSALYFDGRKHSMMTMSEVIAVDRQRGNAIPLHLRFSTGGTAIVGTTDEYYKLRGLHLDTGKFGERYADCVVGASVAGNMQVAPGDFVTSDPKTIFNLTADYPLRLRVTGVLQPTGSADDDVVFVSMDTAWIMEGIGHGHVESPGGGLPGETASDDNSPEKLYLEVTDENVDSFHFHGRRSNYPVTACIIVPKDTRAETLLIGHYASRSDANIMIVEPQSVIRRLLASVLRVRNLVIAGLALVTSACLLLVVFVFWLTFRLRRNEFETLKKIGASRMQISGMLLWEMGLVLALGTSIGIALALLTGRFDQMILRWLI